MNDHKFSSLMQGPSLPPPNFYSTMPLQKKEPYAYSRSEQILAGAAVLIGLWFQFCLFDWIPSDWGLVLLFLPYFLVFALLNRRKLGKKPTLLLATAMTFLLSFSMGYGFYSEYKFLNILILPGLLIALGCYARGNYGSKQVLNFLMHALVGLFADGLTAAHRLPMSIGSLRKDGSGKWKTVAGGLALGFGLLVFLLVPLMSRADQVFSHFISHMFTRMEVEDFIDRLIYTAVVAFGSYSVLWNSRFRPHRAMVKRVELPFQPTIVGVSLGMVLAAYVLFCGVQFTYLFAGAALPQGLTYSEYAVSGFWELVQIGCINLALFGFLVEYGPKTRGFLSLKLGLLAVTGVMLSSAILRLNLYIQAYNGMTWLRLVSMWFLIYMAAVLVLCAVRLFVEKFPVVTVSMVGLLAWWVALGFWVG